MIKNVYIIAGEAKVADIAPSIAQFGIKVNPSELAKKVNEHENCIEYAGYKLIAEFFVNDKKLLFNVKTPITSDLIKKKSKELNIKGKNIKTISLLDIENIAKIKLKDLGTNNLENAIKTVIGSANSCGIKVLYDDEQ